MHEISEVEINGQQIVEAMYREKPAWHRLGNIWKSGDSVTADSETFIEGSHLGWEVGVEEVKGVTSDRNYTRFQGTYRKDTGQPLGIVGTQYTILQNREAFNFLDSLLQDGIMQYEAAFALRGGRQICLLARMPNIDTIAEGDHHLRYTAFNNTHDGTGAITCYPTGVRHVCANTVRLGQQLAGDLIYTIRHSGDMEEKLNTARKYLSQFDKGFTLFRDQARVLATRKFNKVDLEQYLEELFPTPEKERERARNLRCKKLEKIHQHYLHRSRQIPSTNQTWWALFNSVTEYIDHDGIHRGKNERAKAENRFLAVTSGEKAKLKDHAFAVALDMAGVNIAA